MREFRWIPVAEQLPDGDPATEYWIRMEYPHASVGILVGHSLGRCQKGWWELKYLEARKALLTGYKVTHWMPIPPVYETESRALLAACKATEDAAEKHFQPLVDAVKKWLEGMRRCEASKKGWFGDLTVAEDELMVIAKRFLPKDDQVMKEQHGHSE